MNQYFDINRFGKLFKKEFSERISTILTISVIFSIILMLWWFITFLVHMTGNPSTSAPESRATYLFIVVVLMVVSSPLILYYRCNHRKRGVDYITLPASFNEKFVSMLIHTLIIFPITIGLSILATDLVICTINPAVFNGSILLSGLFGAIWDYNSIEALWNIFTAFALFLLCNAVYKKNKTVKSIFSILLFYLVVAIIISTLAYAIYGQWININITGSININMDYTEATSELHERIKPFNTTVTVLLRYLLPVAAFTGAYFKIKRQQY